MKQTIKPIITKELAEEIGIHIGDGSLGFYKKTYHYDYTITGGLDDEMYLLDFVIPLIRKIYGLSPYIQYVKKDNSIMLKYVSKQLILWKKSIGLPIGPKNSIVIPDIIMKSNFVLDCLRGIFDTDGCILFKRRNKDVHYYPVVKLFSISRKLIKQVANILVSEGITLSFEYDLERTCIGNRRKKIHGLYINGEKNVEKFMEKVGFSNIKHFTKYLLWKRQGNLEPYTTLDERMVKLGGCSSVVERHAHIL